MQALPMRETRTRAEDEVEQMAVVTKEWLGVCVCVVHKFADHLCQSSPVQNKNQEVRVSRTGLIESKGFSEWNQRPI